MKAKLYSFDSTPFHVIGKCPKGKWPASNMKDVWDLFGDLLNEFQIHQQIFTHSFVMMSNHYHWLCSFRSDDLIDISQFDWFHEAFSFDFTHSIQMETRIQHGLGPLPIFKCPPKVIQIKHLDVFRQTYAYIYRNPVNAGLVKKAEEYPFSTLYYLANYREDTLKFTCWDSMNFISNPGTVLKFINKSCTFIPLY